MKILIAIDESECSKQLIREVCSRKWSSDTKFLVLNVVAMPAPEFWHDTFDKDIETLVQANKLTKWAVIELKDKLGANISVERSFAEGHVAESIIAAASDWCADLVMLGSHGRRGITKQLLGSVSEAVMMGAGCLVEIFRNHKPAHAPPAQARASATPR